MACGCIVPTEHADLAAIVSAAVPVAYTGLNNVTENGSGGLVRSGGVVNSSDAFAYSDEWCEGTDCAYWEVRQFFNDPACNETIFYVIEDEFGNNLRYGWFFQNGIQNFRRSPYHGTTSDFPIYYGPSGGPAAPNQVGYNVGFRFGIYYNNGTVRLYENVQFTNDTNAFISPESYVYTGLATDRRWRLKVYVFPSSLTAHSNEVVEAFSTPSDVCAVAEWAFPPIQWTASGSVAAMTGGIGTFRFNDGEGSVAYLVPPVSDSGNELRSKNIKSGRVTGKLTNAKIKFYSWDVDDAINVTDLEDGTNFVTDVDLTDTSQVTQSQRQPVNVPNAVLSTVRVEVDDRGKTTRDRIEEILIEQAVQGVRR